jgi:hypothetical protein
MVSTVLRRTWQSASEILAEKTDIEWARSALSLLERTTVHRIGDTWEIRQGEWVSSQDMDTRYPHVWAKVMLTKNLPARITDVSEDGWVLLEDGAAQTRYKVWRTSLRDAK